MKLSEMKQVLVEREIHLTRSLGQNFLHDGNQLRRIVEAGQVTAGGRVLEIGPGLGPLTEELLGRGAVVRAIEKDGRLVAVLQERFRDQPRLELLHADALDYLRENRDWGGWTLISNLPYSVGSPMLVELAQSAPGPDRMVATLQLEVAQRILAHSGDAAYGLLTLLVQVGYVGRGTFRIPASCFFPAPEVDSACLILERRAVPLLDPGQLPAFNRTVKRAFSQRRKMMIKLLRQDWPAATLQAVFADLGLAESVRAEAVSLEHFVRLTNRLAASSSPAHE
jgi:16S rRNA (adenine1518-N6/adenine1519-N6)-dimethyltransferase